MSTKAKLSKKAILIMGPPGAGKGTQADLLAKEINYEHFNIGGYFRHLVAEKNPLMTKDLIEDLFEGEILDPHKFLSIVQKHIQEVSEKSEGIIFSGQPRSILEAFGDDDLLGFVDFIIDLYGKEKIIFFKLNVPEEVTYERNTKRGREDDAPEVIKHRLEEYREETVPVFEELKNRGFDIIELDGTKAKQDIFEEIKEHIT